MANRPKKLPRVLSADEQEQLLAEFNVRWDSALRNKALVTTMLDTGLRAGEIVALCPEHIDWRTCKLTVRQGKGSKDRTLWFGTDLRDLLTEWLERRPESEFVFGTRDGGQLQTRYLREMVKRMARKAEIPEWQRVSPHTLRHTFASDLYRETGDLRLVQQALGHSSVTTTQIYVHLADREVEHALKTFRQSDPAHDEQAQHDELARELIHALPAEIAQALARVAEAE